MDRLELGQEAPAKADEHRYVGAARLLRERPCRGQIVVDGLLAVDGLPRADCSAHQVDVGVGRRGDEDRIDTSGFPNLAWGFGYLPAESLDDPLRC